MLFSRAFSSSIYQRMVAALLLVLLPAALAYECPWTGPSIQMLPSNPVAGATTPMIFVGHGLSSLTVDDTLSIDLPSGWSLLPSASCKLAVDDPNPSSANIPVGVSIESVTGSSSPRLLLRPSAAVPLSTDCLASPPAWTPVRVFCSGFVAPIFPAQAAGCTLVHKRKAGLKSSRIVASSDDCSFPPVTIDSEPRGFLTLAFRVSGMSSLLSEAQMNAITDTVALYTRVARESVRFHSQEVTPFSRARADAVAAASAPSGAALRISTIDMSAASSAAEGSSARGSGDDDDDSNEGYDDAYNSLNGASSAAAPAARRRALVSGRTGSVGHHSSRPGARTRLGATVSPAATLSAASAASAAAAAPRRAHGSLFAGSVTVAAVVTVEPESPTHHADLAVKLAELDAVEELAAAVTATVAATLAQPAAATAAEAATGGGTSVAASAVVIAQARVMPTPAAAATAAAAATLPPVTTPAAAAPAAAPRARVSLVAAEAEFPGTCFDGLLTGGETDVDCGGSGECPGCPIAAHCRYGADCGSGFCSFGVCAASTNAAAAQGQGVWGAVAMGAAASVVGLLLVG